MHPTSLRVKRPVEDRRVGAGTCLDRRAWLTQPASVGFYEWARRLDDRVAVPLNQKIAQPWMGSFMARVGISTAIIFGGGFLVRILLPHRIATAGWALATYAVGGIAGLIAVLVARHRHRASNRE